MMGNKNQAIISSEFFPQPNQIQKGVEGSPYEMPFWKYNSQQNKWEIYLKSGQIKNPQVQTFKCLTYNVWFEPHNFNERLIEILKITIESDAEFVCFQEVTPQFLIPLLQVKEIKEKYFVSGNFINGYGILILQKFQPDKLYEIPFPTQMGRSLLVSLVEINGKTVVISTSHLESLGYSNLIRQKQLKIAYEFFKPYQSVIMMGDFNFDHPKENQYNIEVLSEKQYIDVWKLIRPNEPGDTMKANSKFSEWRPDKVIFKIGGILKPQSIQIIGDYSIPKYQNDVQKQFFDEIVTPSDHLGLLSTFILMN